MTVGIEDQKRFNVAVANAKAGGGDSAWAAAANILSGLAMFDLLPALDATSWGDRDRVVDAGRTALSPGAYQRIRFANVVVTSEQMVDPYGPLPNDQLEDAAQFLIRKFAPSNSQAGRTAFPTADAAAIQAIAEIRPTTSAVINEFAGAIFRQGAHFGFTAPVRGDATSSPSTVLLPAGVTRVGRYHTHPPVGNNFENFSPQDIGICSGIKGNAAFPPLVSYLGTPTGRIKKLTPTALLTGADATQFPLFGKLEHLR